MARKLMVSILVALFVVGMVGVGALAAAKDKMVLMVCVDPQNDSDQAVKSRLEGLGFNVEVVDHGSAADADPNAYGLVVLSSTSSSANIVGAELLLSTTTPIFGFEHAVLDDYQIAPDNGPVDDEAGEFVIKDANHPITKGFKGTVKIWSEANQLHTGAAAAGKALAMLGDSDRAGIIAVEKGDTLADGSKSLRKQVHFSAGDNVWLTATPDAWKLFDQAIQWLVAK